MEAIYLIVFLMPLVGVSFVWVNRSARKAAKIKWATAFLVLPPAVTAAYFGIAQVLARAVLAYNAAFQASLIPYGLAVIYSLPPILFLAQTVAFRMFLRRYPRVHP